MENHVLYLAIHNLQDVGQFFIAHHFLTSLMIHVQPDRLPEGIYAWTIDSSFQPGEVPLFRPVDALAIMGGRAAALISIYGPCPPFATPPSPSPAMSIAALSQIFQQNPGLIPSSSSLVAPPSTPTPSSSKPVNTDNLFVAPTPSDASFKPVVHKFLQPSPRPSVEPVAKTSTSKTPRKTKTTAIAALPSSSRKASKAVVEVPVTHDRNLRSRGPVKRQASVTPPVSRKPPAKHTKKAKREEPESVYSNEEDAEEVMMDLSSDEYRRRHHLLASSEIVDVRDLLVPHLQHSEKIGFHELNLLRPDDMVHVLAGACSFCVSSPVKSSLCEKAICGDGPHDNCALCSADRAKCRYTLRGEEAALHAEVAAYQGQVSRSGLRQRLASLLNAQSVVRATARSLGLALMTLHAIVDDLYLALSDYQLTHGTEWLADPSTSSDPLPSLPPSSSVPRNQPVSKTNKVDSKVYEPMPRPIVVDSPALDDSSMIVDKSSHHRRSSSWSQPEDLSTSMIPPIAVLGNPVTVPPDATSTSTMVAVSSPAVVPSPPSTPPRVKVSGPMDHWVHKTPRSRVVKSHDGSPISAGPHTSSM
ncbi:hypothetical protein C8J56DRAFT_892637 [Mycena floridula]|nr:hypothetical protein C8J56DRAFT_892637 [Mycena floridula]